jgi:hypothetical protein
MVNEVSSEGEPARNWWSSSKVICVKGDLESPRISIADADDRLRAFRGVVWAIAFQLALAGSLVLCWQLWDLQMLAS